MKSGKEKQCQMMAICFFYMCPGMYTRNSYSGHPVYSRRAQTLRVGKLFLLASYNLIGFVTNVSAANISAPFTFQVFF